MSYLDQLRKSSSNNKSFAKLNEQISKVNNKSFANEDDGYWKLEPDKAGNGYAVIRFLPPMEGEDFPFVRFWDHGFKGPGGWYIEKSLTSIGENDPVSELNSKDWNSGIDARKEEARERKRRLRFVSNIYVVKDPAHPENEGKVFKFRYGKSIFDKLNEAMNPQFPDEKPFDPFDIFTGANFNLKVRKADGYPKYDRSGFDSPAPLSSKDEVLEEVVSGITSLQEIVDPKNYKSYDELKARLHRVLQINDTGNDRIADRSEDFKPSFKSAEADQPEYKKPSFDDDDDDDEMSYFRNLAKDE